MMWYVFYKNASMDSMKISPSVTIAVCLFLLNWELKQIGNSCRGQIDGNGIIYFMKNYSPMSEIFLDFFKRGALFLSLLILLIIIFWRIWKITFLISLNSLDFFLYVNLWKMIDAKKVATCLLFAVNFEIFWVVGNVYD